MGRARPHAVVATHKPYRFGVKPSPRNNEHPGSEPSRPAVGVTVKGGSLTPPARAINSLDGEGTRTWSASRLPVTSKAARVNVPNLMQAARCQQMDLPMARSDLVQRMIQSHQRGDDAAFRRVAEENVVEERRKRHDTLADELERLLSGRSGRRPLTVSSLKPLPKTRDDADLLRLIDPTTTFHDLVLKKETEDLLKESISEYQQGSGGLATPRPGRGVPGSRWGRARQQRRTPCRRSEGSAQTRG